MELRAINGVSTVTGDFTCCYIGYLIGTAGTVAGAERTLFVIPAQCIGTKVGDGRIDIRNSRGVLIYFLVGFIQL